MDAEKIIGEVILEFCRLFGAETGSITISRDMEKGKVVLFRNRYRFTGESSNSQFTDNAVESTAEQRLLFPNLPLRRVIRGGMVSVQEGTAPFLYRSAQFEGLTGLSLSWVAAFEGNDQIVFKRLSDDFYIEVSLCADGDLFSNTRELRSTAAGFCLRLLEKTVPMVAARDYSGRLNQKSTDADEKLFEPRIVGNSRIIRSLKEQIRKVAKSELSVLIEGESGTGKEIIAKNIHRLSRRSAGPLVAVNCTEVQPSLLRAELFGHARGAFTGAVGERAGLVESARGGTFFLDEIGEMPVNLQAALLRVIQEREIRRVGESGQRDIDVRFIFATNKNLSKLVKKGCFREDLFYRVCGTRIYVSPLRERKEDILILASHFLHRQAGKESVPVPRLAASAAGKMLSYNWPGNVRELVNEMERAVAFNDGRRLIRGEILSEKLSGDNGKRLAGICEYPETLPDRIMALEEDIISSVLEKFDGNRTKSAGVLGISRQGLLNKMRKYGLR